MKYSFPAKWPATIIALLVLCYGVTSVASVASAEQTTHASSPSMKLSAAEQHYLAAKERLRICVDPDWMPIESIRSGRHTGMTADYMELLGNRMGIAFELVPTTSWKQTLEYGKERRCDLISLAMSTPERRLSFYFSKPYFTTPLVLATRTSTPFLADISLAKGKRIGVKKDYAFGALFRSKYKDLEIIDITSLAEGLAKVRDGKLYGIIGALPSVAYILQKSFTDKLKISGKTGEMLELRMALRNDEPELLSSMNRAIATIDEADHQEILNDWISVRYEKGTDYTAIIGVVTGSLLIIGLLFYRHVTLTKFNTRLRQQNTEIRRQSEVLQTTQQQLLMTQHAIDTCSFPIFWLCRRPAPQRNSMVHANVSAARHLGYSLDEFLQLTPETILAQDISTPGTALFEILDKNTGVPYKTVFRRKDGSTFPVELHCSSFNYEDNRYLFIFYNDISIQQEMEAKLHRSMKMEAVGMLAGGVAHDLNNILSGIVSYPELLLLQLDKDDPMRPKLEAIQRSGRQAADIVDDLLTMARSGNAARQIASITTIVKEYCSSPEYQQLQQRYPEVECALEMAEDICTINCSPLHIKKAIMNLLVNGYEATLPGGYIRIATYNLHISGPDTTTQYLEPGDYVVFEVTDSGPGIAEEHIDHIFEPFFSKKKQGSSGTGLGLSIVYNTALDHGGTVTVNNTSEGARFCLFVPACRDEVMVAQTSALEEELFGNGEKILVIDDEPQQLDIAGMMLEKLGYSCVSAASGEEAIKRVEQEAFALILLDMIMHSGIGGRETYRAILARRPGQKAIIVSGFSENEDVKHTLDMGAGSFVRKPYSMHTLASAVKEVLA
ncbi:MAG: transporter substrate-binding domain-containing protein [Desulfopila sp.]